MADVKELIRQDGDKLSFGDISLAAKTKKEMEFQGDVYKIKTFKEITKLEKNGAMVYESTPGTVVHELDVTASEVSFGVESNQDAQITLELESEQEYKILVDDVDHGKMKTNLGGKLSFSVELNPNVITKVKIEKQ